MSLETCTNGRIIQIRPFVHPQARIQFWKGVLNPFTLHIYIKGCVYSQTTIGCS